MQRTTSGTAGNGLHTTIKFMRGAAGIGLSTTAKYLRRTTRQRLGRRSGYQPALLVPYPDEVTFGWGRLGAKGGKWALRSHLPLLKARWLAG